MVGPPSYRGSAPFLRTETHQARLGPSGHQNRYSPQPDRCAEWLSEFTIGQVSESWENLRGMLEDRSKALGYGLVWLADVLRAIGDEEVG